MYSAHVLTCLTGPQFHHLPDPCSTGIYSPRSSAIPHFPVGTRRPEGTNDRCKSDRKVAELHCKIRTPKVKSRGGKGAWLPLLPSPVLILSHQVSPPILLMVQSRLGHWAAEAADWGQETESKGSWGRWHLQLPEASPVPTASLLP